MLYVLLFMYQISTITGDCETPERREDETGKEEGSFVQRRGNGKQT